MVRTDDHREHLVIGWRAGPLATDVEEDRTVLLIEELIIVPVSLFVSSLILFVKVVDLILEVVSVILIHGNSEVLPALGASMKFLLWWCSCQTTNRT